MTDHREERNFGWPTKLGNLMRADDTSITNLRWNELSQLRIICPQPARATFKANVTSESVRQPTKGKIAPTSLRRTVSSPTSSVESQTRRHPFRPEKLLATATTSRPARKSRDVIAASGLLHTAVSNDLVNYTRPGARHRWIALAKGLTQENGGILSHANVARELGGPEYYWYREG